MSETSLQSNVVKYIKLQYPNVRYCASLGGQYQRYPSQRNKAKATGYVRGFPDLVIYEAKGGFFGLFLEIKTLKGYPTTEQKQWIVDLTERGYMAKCIKGIDAIIKQIDEYLTFAPTKQCACNEKDKQ